MVANDVFLGEFGHQLGSSGAYIQLLATTATKTYYFVDENQSRLEEVTSFTAGVNAGTIYNYVALNLSNASAMLVGYTGGLPQPTEELVGALRVHEVSGELWTCIRDTEVSTHATGTFSDLVIPATGAIVHSLADAEAAVEDSEIYVVLEDQFYTGVEVRTGTVEWIADDARDALEDLDSTVFTSPAHWMGQFRSDIRALESIPSIQSGFIYAYFNEALDTIRVLDASTFVAAGSPFTHPKWIPTKGDNRLMRVIRPDHMGRWPVITEHDLNRTIGFKGDRLYTAQVHRTFDTSVTNTWANVATDGDDALIANYRGAFAQHGGTYSAADYDVDDIIYLYDTDTWLKVFQPGATKYFTGTHAPSGFVGHFASQADALAKYDFDTISADDTPTQAAWTGAAIQKLTVHTSRTVENSVYFMGVPPPITGSTTEGGELSPGSGSGSAAVHQRVTLVLYTREITGTVPTDPTATWGDEGLTLSSLSAWKQDEDDVTVNVGGDTWIATASADKAVDAEEWTQSSWVKNSAALQRQYSETDDPDQQGSNAKTDDHLFQRIRIGDGEWSDWFPIGMRVHDAILEWTHFGGNRTLNTNNDGAVDLATAIRRTSFQEMRVVVDEFTSWANWSSNIFYHRQEAVVSRDMIDVFQFTSDAPDDADGTLYCQFEQGEPPVVDNSEKDTSPGTLTDVRWRFQFQYAEGAASNYFDDISRIWMFDRGADWVWRRIKLYVR